MLAFVLRIPSLATHGNLSTCFFDYTQAHWRKILSLRLMPLYIGNEDYSRMFTALAFVPEHFNDLKFVHDALKKVLSLISLILVVR